MKNLVILSLMRRHGETGVQTHMREFISYLETTTQRFKFLDPFSVSPLLYAPIFGLRYILKYFSRGLGVWWYRSGHAFCLYLALFLYLLRHKNVCVYAQCPISASVAMRLRWLGVDRVVLVVHFNESQADEWAGKGEIQKDDFWYKLIYQYETKKLSSVDGIIFVSSYMREKVLSRFGGAVHLKSVSSVVPNFVANRGLKKKVFDFGSPRLVCIGTLESRKNQAYAIEILSALRNLNFDFSIDFFGQGTDLAALKLKVTDFGLDAKVNFRGFVKDTISHLSNYDACLHVAKIENLPVALIEAMSVGLPLFVVPVGGIPDLFTDGSAGRFLPADDASLSAKIISEEFSSNSRIISFGMESYRRYVDQFSPDVVGALLLKKIRGES